MQSLLAHQDNADQVFLAGIIGVYPRWYRLVRGRENSTPIERTVRTFHLIRTVPSFDGKGGAEGIWGLLFEILPQCISTLTHKFETHFVLRTGLYAQGLL